MNFKWLPIRRCVQIAMVILIASPLSGATIFSGNLAAASLLTINMADPLAFLQATLASRQLVLSFGIAAFVVTVSYLLVGGRTFCGWVCPVGLLTELTDSIRKRIGSADRTAPLNCNRWTLVLVLFVSAAIGVPLFEIISPIGVTARMVMFSHWAPFISIMGTLCIIEVCIARRVWCRSLCPVGGFYALLGRISPLRIGFTSAACTHCGACSAACPVEEVLAPSLGHDVAQVTAGDCIRCAACIDACPTKALAVTVGYR